jgi:transcriptional regulator with XRE-family HTH domain
MSRYVDMRPFRERLKEAAKHACVEYGQTAIAKSLGVSKQTVDQWMAAGRPTPETIFVIADKWNVSARWLATEVGPMVVARPEMTTSESIALPSDELELLSNYRQADGRWKLALRLLAALGTEQQVEVATDVNVIIARVLRKKPSDLRYASNERVAAAYGDAPHVAARKIKPKG